jgi:ATP-dependent DNA helicase RecG
LNALPFALTKDQSSAVDDVLRDLQSAQPMYRLVQGDVGCGKTLVAAAALYANALAGYQGALLAPTEILAQQHEKSVKKLLESAASASMCCIPERKAAQKKSVLTDLAQGRIDVLIGTHSILQDNVVFQNLGLVIADEQQRFGVEQRRALRQKGTMVDFLLMSATPIPRTLASTLYGDMDISTIQTMPAGRRTPQTVLIQENSFRSVLDQVRALLKSGRQLYVICAAVEDSENYDARNVMDIYESLKKLFQNDCEVGVLHGRMSSEQKQAVMKRFAEGSIGVLVSTTVVEVGMNVVNATGMIVYDADRFGLSQLHQLRGRIQRGSEQGYCWLLTDSKDEKALERLQVLVRSNDGFEISYEDLRLRGPGDILGTRQSGVPDFILGNIVEDTKVIAQARKDAEFILNHAQNPDNAAILNAVQQKNSRNASYID